MERGSTSLRIKDHPVFLMWWYGACSIFSIASYVHWVRDDDTVALIGEDVKRAYVAFVVLTILAYVFVAGLCFFWAAFYCSQDAGRAGIKERNRRVHTGMVAIYFASDTPLFIIDLYIVYWHGWIDEVQGIAFVLKILSWMVGTFFVWFVYMWKMSKFLHKRTGADREIQLAAAPGVAFNIGAVENLSPDV